MRQLELDTHSAIAKTLAKAAEGYVRDARNVASESKEIACVLVVGLTHEDENDKKICDEILQELEICVVAYFSFHWQHATSVVDQVHSQISRKPNTTIFKEDLSSLPASLFFLPSQKWFFQ